MASGSWEHLGLVYIKRAFGSFCQYPCYMNFNIYAEVSISKTISYI